MTTLSSICDNSTPRRPFLCQFYVGKRPPELYKICHVIFELGFDPLPFFDIVKKNIRFGTGGLP